MNFLKTPQGKIIGYLIHEQNSAIGYLRFCIGKLKDAPDFPNKQKSISLIESAIDKLKESGDYTYTKMKELTEKE